MNSTIPVKFTAKDLRHGASFDLGNGRTAKVDFVPDSDHGAPWKECDGHGVVSEWTTRSKKAGERVLCCEGRKKRYYDFAESIRLAKRDGWGVSNTPEGATKGQIAALAVESDFEYLRQWCEDLWSYIGIQITVTNEEGEQVDADSLWGVETYKDYHLDQACEMLNALVDQLNEQDLNEPACHI